MSKTINWGILGCGKIAHKFAEDLKLVEGAKLLAVASRSQQRANDFGKIHQANHSYGNYEDLVNNNDVDIIYIATRHPQHHSTTMLCLEHNKHVLCEKPLGMNSTQVLEMVTLAQRKGLFLMEAMWTRFIPAVQKMKALIEAGVIGDIKIVQADFGYQANRDPNSRLFNKALGGGSLMDIGIYPLYISLLALGMPSSLSAKAIFTDTGVDESCAMILEYNSGALAVLYSTFTSSTPVEATIQGTKGSLKLHHRFHHASKISLLKDGAIVESFDLPILGIGYTHEIAHVNECIQEGLTESPKMNHQDSVNLIALLDQVRDKIGLIY